MPWGMTAKRCLPCWQTTFSKVNIFLSRLYLRSGKKQYIFKNKLSISSDVYKDGCQDSPQNLRPKYVDLPLVVRSCRGIGGSDHNTFQVFVFQISFIKLLDAIKWGETWYLISACDCVGGSSHSSSADCGCSQLLRIWVRPCLHDVFSFGYPSTWVLHCFSWKTEQYKLYSY